VAEQQQDKPSYCNAAYREMSDAWEIMSDVSMGTPQLRKKGEKYLPREPKEKDERYRVRLALAIFFNAVERTKNGLVGMVFRKEPKLLDDVPLQIRGEDGTAGTDKEELGMLRQLARIAIDFEWNLEGAVPTDADLWTRIVALLVRLKELATRYREWLDSREESVAKVEGYWENIDNCGTHGSVFAKELFTSSMQDGHALLLTDAPPLPSRADGQPATLQDLRDAKWRPYWVQYRANQIVNWRTQVVAGQVMLSQLTLKECALESDGIYGEREVVRYRVLRPGEWYLFKEVKGQGETEYVPDGNGSTGLTEIPVAVVYSRKKGLLRSQPPLLDQALINIAHYQKYSDHSTYLHIASRPILWFRNRDKAKNVEPIGPYVFFDVTGESGLVAFAETTGAALSASREDIKDLEGQMAALGLSIIAGKSPQPNTATEELLDHVQEESDLATAARSLKDCMELGLKFMAQFEDPKATTGGSVELGATLEELTLDAQEMQQYSNMASLKQLSLDTLWAILGRAGKLPANFDAEREKAAIKADSKDMGSELLTQFERGDSAPNLGEESDDE
jgi:uncharacterized protein DUF4055